MVLSGAKGLLGYLQDHYNFTNDDQDRVLRCVEDLSKHIKVLPEEAGKINRLKTALVRARTRLSIAQQNRTIENTKAYNDNVDEAYFYIKQALNGSEEQ